MTKINGAAVLFALRHQKEGSSEGISAGRKNLVNRLRGVHVDDQSFPLHWRGNGRN